MRRIHLLLVVLLTMTFYATGARAKCKSEGTNVCWTFVIYLNSTGDRERLHPELVNDMEELAKVGSPDGVEILVQFLAPALNGKVTATLRRLRHASTSSPTEDWEDSFDVLATNQHDRFDEAAPLVEAIELAYAQFPAQRYGLVVGSHGTGMRAPHVADGQRASDDAGRPNSSEPDSYRAVGGLPTRELRNALELTKNKLGQQWQDLDLIAFDACLMGAVEVAYGVSPHARFMVASQAQEQLTGWDYEKILQKFIDATKDRDIGKMNGNDIAQMLVEYRAKTASAGEVGELTIAAFDLAAFRADSESIKALDTLGNALKAWVERSGDDDGAWNSIAQARSQCKPVFGYGEPGKSIENALSIDLWCLAGKLAELPSGSDEAVRSASKALRAQLKADALKSASRKYHCIEVTDGPIRKGCIGNDYNELVRGLSVYYPWRDTIRRDRDSCGYAEKAGAQGEDRPHFVSEVDSAQGTRGGWVRWIRTIGRRGNWVCS